MKALKFSRKHLGIPYAVFMLAFVVFPLLLIILYAFTVENREVVTNDITAFSFSFSNFTAFFSSSTNIRAIYISFALAILTTVICLLIAYPVAYILARSRMKTRSVLLMIFILPMWINFLLRIIAIRMLLSDNGILNSVLSALNLPNFSIMYTPAAIVIGMVYDYFPFMVLPIYNALIKIDRNLLEAAGDLGATPGRTFRKIIFPLSVPGVISGITMVFVPSISEFVIADILGGGKVGEAAADALERRGLPFCLVEKNPRLVPPDDPRYILGNAGELAVLQRAHIMETPSVIVTTHDDDLNI